jgi:L-ascorbate metabolism protein UlaG (beta-lactamase superfamily)
VLVTHAHFDHLLDVHAVMERTGAKLISDPTAIHLVKSIGVPPGRCEIVMPGAVRTIGPWTIRVFPAEHDKLFGSTPFPGRVETATRPPKKASDWVLGEPLAFVIEAAGKRIYIDSGGVPGAPPSAAIGHVDLAILGVALPDSRQRFAEAVHRLTPATFCRAIKTIFRSAKWRIRFGKLTNFCSCSAHKEEHLPGRVILLDYFHPWTLR